MPKMIFSLNIAPEKYRSYYEGAARAVSVQAEDGRRLQFPAAELQQYVTHSGVQGRFEIEFSDEYKLLKISKII